MYDVKEKLPQNDRDVVIEDDVWIGANAVILKGVTVGRGSIVGAGSVVTRDIPRYSIFVGQRASSLRPRWDPQTVALHEKQVYGQEP
jgi:acetyltransferase-like isoleucine patch superfamily enzyme